MTRVVKKLMGIANVMSATGGNTIAANGTKTVHTFTSDGNFVVTGSGVVEVLVIAGGGGGGTYGGGGGGGGGFMYARAYPVSAGTYAVVVGGGGNGTPASASTRGSNGNNSSFGSLIAIGGGGGGAGGGGAQNTGANGGSSGGGGGYNGGASASGGTDPSQGYLGGNGTSAGTYYGAGGGGGAGGAGGNGSSSAGGAAGAGRAWTISGASVTYAAGAVGVGATGTPANGAANTGNGGKGAPPPGSSAGGNGGSGIVIVSYEANGGKIKKIGKKYNTPQELSECPLLSDANLVAYYKMSAGALTTDSGANGKTLTNTNAVADGTGKFGGAADFGATNTNKELSIADAMSIDGGNCSFSFWFKSGDESVTANQRNMFCQGSNTSKTGFLGMLYNSKNDKILNFNRYKSGVISQNAAFSTCVGADVWNHCVMTYDGTNQRIYLNAVKLITQAASGNGTSTFANQFRLGSNQGVTEWWNGLIDDFAIFNRVLSDAEVMMLFCDTKKIMGKDSTQAP